MTTQNALNTQLVLPAGSTAINSLLYTSAANVVSGLATANSATLITSAGGIPSLSQTLPSAVQGNITSVGALASGSLAAGFTTVTVPLGGTGNTTFTAYAVICAGTTATGAFQNVSGVGASGQVLTSNGAAALPTWQNATGTGTVNSGTINQLAYYAATGSAVSGLATANNGIVLTSNSGVPSVATTFGQGLAVASSVLSVGGANNISFNTTKGIQDNNGNNVLVTGVVGSAVNYIQVFNNIAGSAPVIAAIGSDTNIALTLNGKGNLAINLQGTAAGGNAIAGYVGELISSVIASGSAVSVSTGVPKDLTTISVTAGDWDVYGNIAFLASGANMSTILCNLGLTTASNPDVSLKNIITVPGVTNYGLSAPYFRVSVSTTTTVYLTGRADFLAGTVTMCGGMYARRVR